MTRLVRLAVPVALAAGTSLAVAFSTGPPASRTGAPTVGGVAAEAVCRNCHSSFPLDIEGATLEILDLPAHYVPDSLYDVRVRMTSTFTPPRRWGFQITAVRELNGQGAGTFDLTGAAGVQQVAGAGAYASRRYVQHTSAGTFDENLGPVQWTFRWRAPAANLGRILFFAAGNAANSSNTNSGDRIYTARDTIDPHPLLGRPAAPLAARDALEPARPSPFRRSTTVAWTLGAPAAIDLAVHDAQGRRARTLAAGERPAGRGAASWDGRRDDGAAAAPGVYFVRLAVRGRAILTTKVVLGR